MIGFRPLVSEWFPFYSAARRLEVAEAVPSAAGRELPAAVSPAPKRVGRLGDLTQLKPFSAAEAPLPPTFKFENSPKALTQKQKEQELAQQAGRWSQRSNAVTGEGQLSKRLSGETAKAEMAAVKAKNPTSTDEQVSKKTPYNLSESGKGRHLETKPGPTI